MCTTKPLYYLLVLLIGLIFILILKVINTGPIFTIFSCFKKLNWYLVFSIIIAGITAIFIFLQWRVNKLLAKFTYMPSVGFALKSGKTDYFQKGGKNCPSQKRELDTRLLVKNNSKFPIYFWMRVNLEVKYRNGSRKSLDKDLKYSWRMNPGERLDGHDGGEILCQAIMNKSYKEINWSDDTVFNQRLEKIKRIFAIIEISYAPLVQKNLIFEVEPDIWSFDPISFKWIDSRGTSDDNIII